MLSSAEKSGRIPAGFSSSLEVSALSVTQATAPASADGARSRSGCKLAPASRFRSEQEPPLSSPAPLGLLNRAGTWREILGGAALQRCD
jgi:hypothetical protein